MAIISGYEVSKEQAAEFQGHEDCDLHIFLEWDGHVYVACNDHHEILIDFYPDSEDTGDYITEHTT